MQPAPPHGPPGSSPSWNRPDPAAPWPPVAGPTPAHRFPPGSGSAGQDAPPASGGQPGWDGSQGVPASGGQPGWDGSQGVPASGGQPGWDGSQQSPRNGGRRRTPLLAGVGAVLVILLTAGLTAAVVLITNPDRTAQVEVKGSVVTGDGYQLTIPDGFLDDTRQYNDLLDGERSTPVQLGLLGNEEQGFRSTIAVRVTALDPDQSTPTAAQLAERIEGNLDKEKGISSAFRIDESIAYSDPSEPLYSPDAQLRVGGEPAEMVKYQGRFNDRDIEGYEVVFVRGGRIYTVTHVAHTDQNSKDRPELESLLASWKWQE